MSLNIVGQHRQSTKGTKQTEEETEVQVQTFEYMVTKHIIHLAFVHNSVGSFADPTERQSIAIASACQLLEYTENSQ